MPLSISPFRPYYLPQKFCSPRFLGSPNSVSFRRVSISSAIYADRDAFTEKSGYLFNVSSREIDSLSDYDVQKITYIYRNKPLVLFRRLYQVGSTLGYWFLERYIDGFSKKSDQMFETRAAKLKNLLLELGPAYIKIAQAISSRADLVPPSYVDQLSLLQDRIAPFTSALAFETIEMELKSPIDDIFSEISLQPAAAASLGQVYKARLRSNGQLVAVKVQRPGVQAAISIDILILRFIAGVIKKAGKFNTDLQSLVDEWATSLFREMDYVKESSNGHLFGKLYGGITDVVVPKMYPEFSTRKVIVMEWIEGEKLSEVKDLNLVEVGVYCSFNQILENGFYHADPHPGNVLRTNNGKLAYIDFGMMGEFGQELRDGFIEACLHLVNRDFDSLAKDFVTLGLLPPSADKEAVTSALTGVFQNAVAKGIRNISFGDLLGDLGFTMYKFKFRIPSYFSLVIRSLAVLEGIAIGIDPNYKVLGSTYPWIARKVLTDSSPKLTSSLRSLLYKGGSFRIDRLESLLSESLRVAPERQRGTGDSSVVVTEILSFTLTNRSSFVRNIILEEIAKVGFSPVSHRIPYQFKAQGLEALGVATNSVIVSRLFLANPDLSDEDFINLETLRRLLLLFARSIGMESSGESSVEETVLSFYRAPPLPKLLALVVSVSELPEDVRRQLLSLPEDLSRRVLSRFLARTIRTALL